MRNLGKRPWALVAGFALLTQGLTGCCCEPTTSTSDLLISADVIAMDQTETLVRVRLEYCPSWEGDVGTVELGCGDRLSAEALGERQELEPTTELRRGGYGTRAYTAEFPTAAAETEFQLSFQRPDEDDPPAETGTLPPPFEFTSPPPEEPVSREGDALSITWEPSGTSDDMYLNLEWVDHSCVDDQPIGDPPEWHIPDTGSYVIEPGTLPPGPLFIPECTVRLILRRTRRPTNYALPCGTIDLALKQERSFTFVSVP